MAITLAESGLTQEQYDLLMNGGLSPAYRVKLYPEAVDFQNGTTVVDASASGTESLRWTGKNDVLLGNRFINIATGAARAIPHYAGSTPGGPLPASTSAFVGDDDGTGNKVYFFQHNTATTLNIQQATNATASYPFGFGTGPAYTVYTTGAASAYVLIAGGAARIFYCLKRNEGLWQLASMSSAGVVTEYDVYTGKPLRGGVIGDILVVSEGVMPGAPSVIVNAENKATTGVNAEVAKVYAYRFSADWTKISDRMLVLQLDGDHSRLHGFDLSVVGLSYINGLYVATIAQSWGNRAEYGNEVSYLYSRDGSNWSRPYYIGKIPTGTVGYFNGRPIPAARTNTLRYLFGFGNSLQYNDRRITSPYRFAHNPESIALDVSDRIIDYSVERGDITQIAMTLGNEDGGLDVPLLDGTRHIRAVHELGYYGDDGLPVLIPFATTMVDAIQRQSEIGDGQMSNVVGLTMRDNMALLTDWTVSMEPKRWVSARAIFDDYSYPNTDYGGLAHSVVLSGEWTTPQTPEPHLICKGNYNLGVLYSSLATDIEDFTAEVTFKVGRVDKGGDLCGIVFWGQSETSYTPIYYNAADRKLKLGMNGSIYETPAISTTDLNPITNKVRMRVIVKGRRLRVQTQNGPAATFIERINMLLPYTESRNGKYFIRPGTSLVSGSVGIIAQSVITDTLPGTRIYSLYITESAETYTLHDCIKTLAAQAGVGTVEASTEVSAALGVAPLTYTVDYYRVASNTPRTEAEITTRDATAVNVIANQTVNDLDGVTTDIIVDFGAGVGVTSLNVSFPFNTSPAGAYYFEISGAREIHLYSQEIGSDTWTLRQSATGFDAQTPPTSFTGVTVTAATSKLKLSLVDHWAPLSVFPIVTTVTAAASGPSGTGAAYEATVDADFSYSTADAHLWRLGASWFKIEKPTSTTLKCTMHGAQAHGSVDLGTYAVSSGSNSFRLLAHSGADIKGAKTWIVSFWVNGTLAFIRPIEAFKLNPAMSFLTGSPRSITFTQNLLAQRVDAFTLDPNESPVGAMQRVLEGHNLKAFARSDGTLKLYRYDPSLDLSDAVAEIPSGKVISMARSIDLRGIKNRLRFLGGVETFMVLRDDAEYAGFGDQGVEVSNPYLLVRAAIEEEAALTLPRMRSQAEKIVVNTSYANLLLEPGDPVEVEIDGQPTLALVAGYSVQPSAPVMTTTINLNRHRG